MNAIVEGQNAATPTQMPAHQERVIVEKRELDEKREKLRAFIGNGIWRTLGTVEQSRLNRQLEAMTLYSHILGERIGAFTEVNACEMSVQEWEIRSNKQRRKDIDEQIQGVKNLPFTYERRIAVQKLQEAVMWLGMDLKRLNEPNPYPNSKDPSNTKIEPTADGLKL